MSIQALSTIFYVDEGLVTSPKSALLQGAFVDLTCLFAYMGLWNNKGKTVNMACFTYHTPHAWSVEAYTWRVTGRELSNRERLQQWVRFLE